jgi:murein DD-endopeptidase MepM/ murein hydrolase activator NlpD
VPAPSIALRGRIVLAAVAAGAFAAAGATLNPTETSKNADWAPLASGGDANTVNAEMGVGGPVVDHDSMRPQVFAVARSEPGQLERLTKGQQVIAERAAREAEARRPLFVAPTVGTLTSAFGSRWGTTHWGIDIANRIGTPIYSAHDGVVIEAGPASGFGLWVRVEHADGTITVYGHVDRILVREGTRVRAGHQIATMGNRGYSTGPHLHFEVWSGSGQKINPLTWLRNHGIRNW